MTGKRCTTRLQLQSNGCESFIEKKTPTTKTLQDLKELFLQKIDHLLLGFDEGHVVFNKYDEKSLKNKTRIKRAKSQNAYELHANM